MAQGWDIGVFDRNYNPVIGVTVAEMDTDKVTILNSGTTGSNGFASVTPNNDNWIPHVLVSENFKKQLRIIMIPTRKGGGEFWFDILVDNNWAAEVAAGRGAEGDQKTTQTGFTYNIVSIIQYAWDGINSMTGAKNFTSDCSVLIVGQDCEQLDADGDNGQNAFKVTFFGASNEETDIPGTNIKHAVDIASGVSKTLIFDHIGIGSTGLAVNTLRTTGSSGPNLEFRSCTVGGKSNLTPVIFSNPVKAWDTVFPAAGANQYALDMANNAHNTFFWDCIFADRVRPGKEAHFYHPTMFKGNSSVGFVTDDMAGDKFLFVDGADFRASASSWNFYFDITSALQQFVIKGCTANTGATAAIIIRSPYNVDAAHQIVTGNAWGCELGLDHTASSVAMPLQYTGNTHAEPSGGGLAAATPIIVQGKFHRSEFSGNGPAGSRIDLQAGSELCRINGMLIDRANAGAPTHDANTGSLFIDADSNTLYINTSAMPNGTTWSILGIPGGGGAAPADAQFLTLALDGDLANERVFTPGTLLTAVDGGAGGTYTLNAAVTGADVTLPVIGTPTYTHVEDLQTTFHSSGWFSGGAISDAGGATIDVAVGTGVIRATDSAIAQLLFFDWAASTGLAITANSIRYIGVEYNAGSPQVVVRTSNDFDHTTDFPLGTVVNEGGTLHIQNAPWEIGDHANTMIQRLRGLRPIARDVEVGGLIFSETGTRNVAVTAGRLWRGLTKFAIGALDTNPGGAADTFDTYSSGGAEATGVAAWPNEQYDNAGTLTTMTNNRWANLWWYIELDGELVMVYGTAQYVTQAQAENEAVPSVLPDRLQVHGILASRFIFQKSAGTAAEILSAFAATFATLGATDHGNLAGLADDDHTQYALLAGRAGGQTFIGGDAASEDIVLQATAHATKTGSTVTLSVDTNASMQLSATKQSFGSDIAAVEFLAAQVNFIGPASLAILEFNAAGMTIEVDLLVEQNITIEKHIAIGANATVDTKPGSVLVLTETSIATANRVGASGNIDQLDITHTYTPTSISSSAFRGINMVVQAGGDEDIDGVFLAGVTSLQFVTQHDSEGSINQMLGAAGQVIMGNNPLDNASTKTPQFGTIFAGAAGIQGSMIYSANAGYAGASFNIFPDALPLGMKAISASIFLRSFHNTGRTVTLNGATSGLAVDVNTNNQPTGGLETNRITITDLAAIRTGHGDDASSAIITTAIMVKIGAWTSQPTYTNGPYGLVQEGVADTNQLMGHTYFGETSLVAKSLADDAVVTIDQQSSTGVIPALIINQADISEGLINFIASARGTGSTAATDIAESVRVELNGTVYRLALYTDA